MSSVRFETFCLTGSMPFSDSQVMLNQATMLEYFSSSSAYDTMVKSMQVVLRHPRQYVAASQMVGQWYLNVLECNAISIIIVVPTKYLKVFITTPITGKPPRYSQVECLSDNHASNTKPPRYSQVECLSDNHASNTKPPRYTCNLIECVSDNHASNTKS